MFWTAHNLIWACISTFTFQFARMHIFAEKYCEGRKDEFCVTTEKCYTRTCRSDAHWRGVLVTCWLALLVVPRAPRKRCSVGKKNPLGVFKIRCHYYSLLADYIKTILQEFPTTLQSGPCRQRALRGMCKGNTHVNIYLPRLFWRRLCSCHRSLPHSDIRRPHPHTPGRFWKVLTIQ